MAKYPAQIDTNTSLPTVVDNFTPVQGSIFNKLRDAVIAIEQELGVKPSASYSTVRARIDALETALGNLQIIELAGDLGGTLNIPKVIGIQGFPVSDGEPSFNDVLTWNGVAWIPANTTGGTIGATGPIGPTGPAGPEGEILPEPVTSSNASYTPTISEAGKYIILTNAAPTFIVPSNGSVPFTIGTVIIIIGTSGQITIDSSAVTLVKPSDTNAKSRITGSTIALKKTATNTWHLAGDLEWTA